MPRPSFASLLQEDFEDIKRPLTEDDWAMLDLPVRRLSCDKEARLRGKLRHWIASLQQRRESQELRQSLLSQLPPAAHQSLRDEEIIDFGTFLESIKDLLNLTWTQFAAMLNTDADRLARVAGGEDVFKVLTVNELADLIEFTELRFTEFQFLLQLPEFDEGFLVCFTFQTTPPNLKPAGTPVVLDHLRTELLSRGRNDLVDQISRI